MTKPGRMLCGGQINKTDEECLFNKKRQNEGRKYETKIKNLGLSLKKPSNCVAKKRGNKKVIMCLCMVINLKVERFAVCCVLETRRQTEISNQI